MQPDNETSTPFSMMRIFYDRQNTPTLCRVSPTLTQCGRVTEICVFNTVKLGTSASSP